MGEGCAGVRRGGEGEGGMVAVKGCEGRGGEGSQQKARLIN